MRNAEKRTSDSGMTRREFVGAAFATAGLTAVGCAVRRPMAGDASVGPPQLLLASAAGRRQGASDGSVSAPMPNPGWHEFDLAWKNGQLELKLDGQRLGSLHIESMHVPQGTGKALVQGGRFIFGAAAGRGRVTANPAIVALDDLRAWRKAGE